MSSEVTPITVVLGGYAWGNWTSYELESSFTTPADTWSVELANPPAAQLDVLAPGAPVEILVGNEVVLSGQLDQRELRRSRGGTTLRLSGRDLAAPLVDSMPPQGKAWKRASLTDLAHAALLDVGLADWVEADAAADEQREVLKVEVGETWWNVLERLAKKARLMVWMTPDGTLKLGRPTYTGTPVAELTHGTTGTNVLELSHTSDIVSRFSEVTVLGQCAGSDGVSGTRAAHLKGTAADDGVAALGLVRRLVLDDGEIRSSAEALARAQWEVSSRQYQSERVEALVAGQGPTATTVWKPDTLVTLRDDLWGLTGTWWLEARRLTRSAEGTRSLLTLRRPDLLLPAVP